MPINTLHHLPFFSLCILNATFAACHLVQKNHHFERHPWACAWYSSVGMSPSPFRPLQMDICFHTDTAAQSTPRSCRHMRTPSDRCTDGTSEGGPAGPPTCTCSASQCTPALQLSARWGLNMCHGLNCVPQIHAEAVAPVGWYLEAEPLGGDQDDRRSWGWAPQWGQCTYGKRHPDSCLPLSSVWARGRGRRSVGELAPTTPSAGTLVCGHPASRTERNKHILHLWWDIYHLLMEKLTECRRLSLRERKTWAWQVTQHTTHSLSPCHQSDLGPCHEKVPLGFVCVPIYAWEHTHVEGEWASADVSRVGGVVLPLGYSVHRIDAPTAPLWP